MTSKSHRINQETDQRVEDAVIILGAASTLLSQLSDMLASAKDLLHVPPEQEQQ